MKNNTWLKRHRWLLSGLALACLALVIVALIWIVQEHQYQLALAQYNATHPLTRTLIVNGNKITERLPYHPPADTAGPDAWGWAGWILRLLAILIPAVIGLFLHWRSRQREKRQQYLSIHKAHLGQATNRLAEAINANQELPSGVFDAYSKLRELDP